MESQESENISYQTTPNRSDASKLGLRRKGYDRHLLHPYKSHVELNSTAIAPGSIIDKMPLYTPPKPSVHIKNPFEQAWLLKDRLSQPICSPSLFQKVISPIQKSPAFSWNVDEISNLRPAPIDENPTQDFTSWFSPGTESQAQAAIDRFFSSMSHGTLESPKTPRVTHHSVECQTDLWCPPLVPDAAEAKIETAFQRATAGLDESMNTLNSSACSARRKILSVEIESPSDDLTSDDSDEGESMKPMFTATPVKPLLSSPDCSPIAHDRMSFLETSVNKMEESGFQSHSPSRLVNS